MDILSRAAWFLTFSPIQTIYIFVRNPHLRDADWRVARGMDPAIAGRFEALRKLVEFVVVSRDADFLPALAQASIVLRWNVTDPADIPAKFAAQTRFDSKTVLDVDPDRIRKEGSFYIDVSHQLLQNKNTLIEQQRNKFRSLAADLGRFERAFVLATGPSVKDYGTFDYRNTLRVVCNSIILDDALMHTVEPHFLVFGDPIFHYGPSEYAASYRESLRAAARKHEFTIFTTFKNYAILIEAVPDLAGRIIAVPFRANRHFNFDLSLDFEVKTTPNILTLAMLPLATTFSDRISIMGCDGRPMNENKYFWGHNPATQISDKMSNIREVHPAFFNIDYDDYYIKHCNTLEQMFDSGEGEGLRFESVAFSHIPALRKRTAHVGHVSVAATSEKTKVVLIEPDATDWSDHFMSFNAHAVNALQRAGHKATVICNRNIENHILLNHHYMLPRLSETSIVIGKNIENEKELAGFEGEIAGALGECIDDNNVVVMMYHGSVGHAEALSRVLSRFQNARGIVNLYWHMWRECQSSDWIERLRAFVSSLETSESRIYLSAPTEQLCAFLNETSGASVSLAPQPSMLASDEDFPFEPDGRVAPLASQDLAVGPFRVFFPGSARAGKGFEAALEMVERLALEPGVEVTLRRRRPDESREIRFAQRIANFSGDVVIKEGELTHSELKQIYAQSHLVILPYDAHAFEKRSSGLLIDAIYHGIPVITAENCWLGDIVNRYGCGVAVSQMGALDILAAVKTVRSRYAEYASNARVAAMDYFSRNSWAELARFATDHLIASSPEKSPRGSDGMKRETDARKEPERASKADGKKVLIIGNGPSTAALADLGFANIPDDVDTFGMGAAYRYFERINWWPDYYALADSKVVHSHREALKRIIEDQNINTRKFYFSRPLSSHARFELIPHGSTGDFCFKKAIELGYREIYLIGIEGSYVEEIAESRPLTEDEFTAHGFGELNLGSKLRNMLIVTKTPRHNPNYFFDDYQRSGDVYSLPQSGIHRRKWDRAASELVELNGCSVFNLSEHSKIEGFPKISIQEFLEGRAVTNIAWGDRMKQGRRAMTPEITAGSDLGVHGETLSSLDGGSTSDASGGVPRSAHASIDETGVVGRLLEDRRGSHHVMLDVGAHFGSSAKYFDRLGWSIYCFEPDSKNRRQLDERFGDKPHVTIDTRAVSDKSAIGAPFYSSLESTGISALHAFHESHKQSSTVNVTTVGEIVDEHSLTHIDFLKIDVEGHDFAVLKGVPWNRLAPDVIECEFEDAKTAPLGHTWRDMAEFLRAKGYTLYISEWHPIIQYGVRHDWRRIAPYPGCEPAPDAWGNLLAFKDDPGYARIHDAFMVAAGLRSEMSVENENAGADARPSRQRPNGDRESEGRRMENATRDGATMTSAGPASPTAIHKRGKRSAYVRLAERVHAVSPRLYAMLRFVKRTLDHIWLRRAWTGPLAAVLLGLVLMGLHPTFETVRVALWSGAALMAAVFSASYLAFRLHGLAERLLKDNQELKRALAAAREQIRASEKKSSRALAQARSANTALGLETITQARDDIKGLRTELGEVARRFDDMDGKVETFDQPLQSMRNDLKAGADTLEALRSDVSRLRAQVSELGGKDGRTAVSAEFLESSLGAIRGELSKTQAELTSVQAELESVSARVSGDAELANAARRFSPATNAIHYLRFNRSLEDEHIKTFFDTWRRPLSLKLSRDALAYMAHRAGHIETLLSGRLAASVEDVLLRTLVGMSVKRPQLEILEIGTLFGMGAAIMHDALSPHFESTHMTLIDPLHGYYGMSSIDGPTGQPVDERTLRRNLDIAGISKEDYTLIKHLSTDAEALEEAGARQYDLLIIDGDHSFAGVKTDFEQYAPMVRLGGYIIFDDYASPEWPEVSRFVDDVLPEVGYVSPVGASWRTYVCRVTGGTDASPLAATTNTEVEPPADSE
ncbi:MAG: FkbM family methyltransferase [Caulobacterales bacterium]|nr:FkbM family methyltransferase [Caulobacterales bacterium]